MRPNLKLKGHGLLLFSFLLCASVSTLATENQNQSILTIKAAIEIAIANNPTLVQAREKLNQDKAATALVRSALFPYLHHI